MWYMLTKLITRKFCTKQNHGIKCLSTKLKNHGIKRISGTNENFQLTPTLQNFY